MNARGTDFQAAMRECLLLFVIPTPSKAASQGGSFFARDRFEMNLARTMSD